MKAQKISYAKIRKETFTKDELKELDKKAQFRIALRRLREEREEKELTQADLAQISGLPRTTISKIESGYQNVSLGKIMQYADAMDRRVEIRLVEKK